MKPYHYIEYSTIFDSFSSPEFFPVLNWFATEIVIPKLKADAHVTDIGAGTGLFCSILLEQLPNLQLTLVDPTQEMMEIAKNRLLERANYLEMSIDDAINLLPQQDAFVFQRSLYVIYKNEKHCKNLFEKLHARLNRGGFIFIQDFSQKYNIEEYKAYLESCTKTPEDREELMSNISLIEKTLKTFNDQVDKGEFHLFAKEELESMMFTAGFVPLLSGVDDSYVFQRI